jgi:ribosomal protein S28E/S33
MEANEPTYTCGSVANSVWYAFTPSETMSITARVNQWDSILTVFTGSSLTNLTQVDCSIYQSPIPFQAVAGQTYYFQVGVRYGVGMTIDFSLALSPPLSASFYYWPSDPSSYDTISFHNNTYDPVDAPIASVQWQFGDGTTSTDCCPEHRYSVDGDYTARMDVTTIDGRTGSATRVVQVRTHDVSIDRFLVPESATVGQTRSLSVYVKNTRYSENVIVILSRGGVSGFTQVGSLTQYVAARPNRTTQFTFNYTFTPDDAALGRVTFKAEAVLVTGYDALPADNTVISTPTRVA